MVRGLSKALRHAAKDVKRWSRENDDEWSELNASSSRSRSEPRSFPHDVKEACWRHAAVVKGRDQERWRRDALGNLVFRKLVGCQGCLCYNYDHIVPYSKGGKSTLDNCQVLQTAANSAKGARTSVSTTELMQRSTYCHLAGNITVNESWKIRPSDSEQMKTQCDTYRLHSILDHPPVPFIYTEYSKKLRNLRSERTSQIVSTGSSYGFNYGSRGPCEFDQTLNVMQILSVSDCHGRFENHV